MENLKNYRKAVKYLPEPLGGIFSKIPSVTAEGINEIRLRAQRPVGVSVLGENYFVTSNGSLTRYPSLGIICTSEMIEKAFSAVCSYSVHSFTKEIARGFVTIEGGCRVGICGTAVGDKKPENIKNISGLNFRIAGQALAGDALFEQFFKDKPVSMLVIGEPLSGKTTLLKGLCRCLGSRYRVSVIDERSEIASCFDGVPQNDVGAFTDVFDGFDKKYGIETAVRVMSPQLIICDEIGGEDDCEAVLSTVNSGVKFIASVHGRDLGEIMRRDSIQRLIKRRIFDYCAVLSSSREPGKIVSVQRLGDMP